MINPSWKGQPVFLFAMYPRYSYRSCRFDFLNCGGIKASGSGLTPREKLFGIDIERLGDAFEKVEGGRKFRVLEPAHVTAAYVGLMSKRFLAEAAGASQVLDVQCYTVPQSHAFETDTAHEISPRDICYIQSWGCGKVENRCLEIKDQIACSSRSLMLEMLL